MLKKVSYHKKLSTIFLSLRKFFEKEYEQTKSKEKLQSHNEGNWLCRTKKSHSKRL